MIDKNQVMFDIERCICHVPDACRDCLKYKEGQPVVICMEELLKDALTLLKEQDNMIPIKPVADFLAGYAVPPILHTVAKNPFLLSDNSGLVAAWTGFLRRFVDYKPDEIQVLDPGGVCPKCRMPIYPEDHPHFCGYCGQAVKWKDRWENDETD